MLGFFLVSKPGDKTTFHPNTGTLVDLQTALASDGAFPILVTDVMLGRRPGVRKNDIVHGLLRLPSGGAGEAMALLPVTTQTELVRTSIGSGDCAPLLLHMGVDAATLAVKLDVNIFCAMGELRTWRAYFQQGRSMEDIAADEQARMIMVRTTSGDEVKIPVYVHPERAWCYLNTIAASDDDDWCARMLENLSVNMFAFVLACRREGKIDIESDDVRTFCQRFEEYAHEAMRIAGGCSSEELEAELIDMFVEASDSAYALPDIAQELKDRSTEDLLSGLDLG